MNGTKVSDSYNAWASQYDTNKNRTRDLEAIALQQMLGNQPFNSILEIGCGTGKNTAWLSSSCRQLTAVDFSDEMLSVAKEKVQAKNTKFISADITNEWNFCSEKYDLITFSLVLEHIDDLEKIFRKISTVIKPEGLVYIGELHPFKQYTGTKAKFETSEGVYEVTCFTHHISDFTDAALKNGFQIQKITEFFDEDNRQGIPRIVSLVFIKN